MKIKVENSADWLSIKSFNLSRTQAVNKIVDQKSFNQQQQKESI